MTRATPVITTGSSVNVQRMGNRVQRLAASEMIRETADVTFQIQKTRKRQWER